jgi:methionyl-tRNA formyltransferase
MREKLKILFLGTPEFAAVSLRRLVEGGYNVVGVVTMPDKPAGRGQKIHQSEVKRYALEAGLRIFQPEKLRDPQFLEELRELDPDLGIVIAFRMLPEVVWSLPRLGTFNLHASLLPQYRGAAPINWAIINGETTTGLTTFMLNAEIDKGAIIRQASMPIAPQDNAGTLHDRMMVRGAELVVETVEAIASGSATPLEQPSVPEGELRPAPKIFRDDCRVDWSRPGAEIVDFIRGLSPYPAAWTEFGDTTIKLFDAEFVEAEGWVAVRELQPAGKRRMSAKEFFNGLKNSLIMNHES